MRGVAASYFGVMSPGVPDFEENGHLPLGRFTVTMDEVYERFVLHPGFAASRTRATCWDGLDQYLYRWQQYADRHAGVLKGRRLFRAMWLGGSFISSKMEPRNLDLTLFVDGEALDACVADKGNSGLCRLTSRGSLLATLHVSPSVVPYCWARSPWMNDKKRDLSEIREFSRKMSNYVTRRGSFDDWWTRVRPTGVPRDEPSEETGNWARGYLEVILA